MTKTEIESFRKNLNDHLKETFKDIDTNISYIIVGSLGFFLTMLDKFFNVQKASFIWVAVLSLVSLLTSFTIWLYNKHLITKLARKQLDFVDDKIIPNPNDVLLEQELLDLWKNSDKKLQDGRKMVYIFLGIGVFLQVTFFSYNIMSVKNEEKEHVQKLKIQVITNDTTSTKVKRSTDTLNF